MESMRSKGWNKAQEQQPSRRPQYVTKGNPYTPEFLNTTKQVVVRKHDSRTGYTVVKYLHGARTVVLPVMSNREEKIEYLLDQLGVDLWKLVFKEWDSPKKLLANMFAPGGVAKYRKLQVEVIGLMKAGKMAEIEKLANDQMSHSAA